ncbi:hypothetical protein [Streptomyces sp. NPDC021356]|uniref:hypothetical protein n=1 Tax=Streptomyces sp. NPDC021356 TaxID=3154900 RepID=UPI0033C99C2C
MSLTLAVSGPLYAALQMCHPGGLPDWLNAATPRCATAGVPLRLDQQQAEELADLTAAAWWECQQADDDGHPLVITFGTACQETLATLETAVG